MAMYDLVIGRIEKIFGRQPYPQFCCTSIKPTFQNPYFHHLNYYLHLYTHSHKGFHSLSSSIYLCVTPQLFDKSTFENDILFLQPLYTICSTDILVLETELTWWVSIRVLRIFHAQENEFKVSIWVLKKQLPIFIHCAKKPVTTMLTYPWKCTVLHCNHLGNTWKPLVLMT